MLNEQGINKKGRWIMTSKTTLTLGLLAAAAVVFLAAQPSRAGGVYISIGGLGFESYSSCSRIVIVGDCDRYDGWDRPCHFRGPGRDFRPMPYYGHRPGFSVQPHRDHDRHGGGHGRR